MTPNLILKQAYGHMAVGEDDDKWKVLNKDGKILRIFNHLDNEHEVMEAIRLGRDYERQAYDEGVKDGQGLAQNLINAKMTALQNEILVLRHENTRMANILDHHISKGAD